MNPQLVQMKYNLILLIFSLFFIYVHLLENRGCWKGYKLCGNRRCISNNKVCDDEDDCGDNTDELDCKSKHLLFQLHFKVFPQTNGRIL